MCYLDNILKIKVTKKMTSCFCDSDLEFNLSLFYSRNFSIFYKSNKNLQASKGAKFWVYDNDVETYV